MDLVVFGHRSAWTQVGRRRFQGSNAWSRVNLSCALLDARHDGKSNSTIWAKTQLRWSVGVKLLSQADEEAVEVESNIPRSIGPGQTVQSPEAIEPHPGAGETDPFFASASSMSRDELDERRNPSGSLQPVSTARKSSESPSIAWTSGPGSAHSMHPPGRRESVAQSILSRRGSSQDRHSKRKLSRTDSGREFWGLPEAPRRQRIALIEEDSSDDEGSAGSDEEWVSSLECDW